MSDQPVATSKLNVFHLVLCGLGGLVLLFIAAPLAGMFLDCSPGQMVETAADKEVQSSIWLTLWTAMGATMVLSLGAIPLAYLLARRNFRFKGLVTGVINLPVVIPHSAAGIAILGVIARDSLLGRAGAQVAGTLTGEPRFSFVNSPVAIMAAMGFVSLPFLINAARDGFLAVPERLEKVANNLGASPVRVFFTVSLPLAWRPILSGLILMWARGMSEFGAVVIVAYHPMVTPVLIFERFGAFGLRSARPVAAVFVLVCLAVFVVLRIVAGERHHAQD